MVLPGSNIWLHLVTTAGAGLLLAGIGGWFVLRRYTCHSAGSASRAIEPG